MKPLLATHATSLASTADPRRDNDTFDSPVFHALLVERDAQCTKETLVTRVRNETTDDN